jgi:hypothetical protein
VEQRRHQLRDRQWACDHGALAAREGWRGMVTYHSRYGMTAIIGPVQPNLRRPSFYALYPERDNRVIK